MQRYMRLLIITLFIIALGYGLWPLISANLGEVKALLIMLKKYCLANMWTGYLLYSLILSIIFFAGLPIATIAMLLGGVIYSFWEATALVMLSRLLIAVAVFVLARHMIDESAYHTRQLPYFMRKLERHPKMMLLLARLSPVPDNVVNYTVAASPINQPSYVILSLIGMIPFTLLCVWAGNQIGTVTHLIRWMQ